MSSNSSKLTVDGMIADMTRDLTSDQRKSIKPKLRVALASFSVKQMERMKKAGVRVWPGSTSTTNNGAPPPFQYTSGKSWIEPAPVSKVKSRANYEFGSRVIFYHSRVTSDDMRHELVHAWDHVRKTSKWKRFDDIKRESDKLKLVENALKTSRKEVMWSGKNSAINAAFQRYKERTKGGKREMCFDNPNTRECYSRNADVHEFYAEAYSVFHGNCAKCKARMRQFAEEVYELLEKEAKGNGLSVPNK